MKMFFAPQVVFTAVIYWIILPFGSTGTCTDWKLVGGRQEFEGLVEVKFNGTTVNICSNFDNITDVCKLIGTQSATRAENCHEKHTTNVFGANLSNYSIIELTSCDKTNDVVPVLQPTCQENEKAEDCCKAVSVCCCGIDIFKQCSANWIKTLKKDEPPIYKLVTAKDVKHLNSSFSISWTASALEGSGGDIDSVRNCSNHCLNELPYRQQFGIKNGTCSCNDTMYTVVDNKAANFSLCIAAKRVEGKLLLVAEDCDMFLPSFIADKNLLKTITAAATTTASTTITKTPRYNTSTPLSTVSDNSSVVTGSLVFIVVCLVCIACLWTCRKRNKAKAERQRPNSVSNRIYGHEMLRQTDDEEYSLIVDCARGNVSYRPPLPVRNGPRIMDTEDANIVTIDDYSSPSDVIKEDFQSDVADEYSTTYDDPIRHPSRRKKRAANCGSTIKEENIGIVAIQHNKEMSDTKSNAEHVSTSLKMESNIIARINAGTQDVEYDIDECVTKTR